MNKNILFHFRSEVKVGELERYVIQYELYSGPDIPMEQISLDSLWLKIKNVSPMSFRAAYLMGPYILYCDVKTQNYHHSQKIIASADQPQFESNLQSQQKFVAELSLHKIQNRYIWIVDVVSQVLFTTNIQVPFEISIGRNLECLRGNIDLLPQMMTADPKLTVTRLTTLDLWTLPKQLSCVSSSKRKKHLIILTHGLHSNVSSDMQYIMEQIYQMQKYYTDEQLIVDGYKGNVCQTERGVKYLGQRVAEYIVNELYDEDVTKISFVAHSLGGLVQTLAIGYIAVSYPWFFERVKPVNFITFASPLLGTVTDNPAYINLLLSFGVIGKTGQDLNLDIDADCEKPLLYLLPGEPIKNILKKFEKRTIYANAINDGIVPLYTSALLFLDYDEILSELDSTATEGEPSNATIPENTDFFNKTFIGPLTKMLSVWTPPKTSHVANNAIPKISFFESAVSIILPPLPDKSFLMDPTKRKKVILHDRIYTEEDLPMAEFTFEDAMFNSKNKLLQAFIGERRNRQKYQKLEEAIARRWHEGLSWRKVIVALKPDAHNNIMVRRRFANAYGWPVVDHMLKAHFTGNQTENGVNSESASTAEEPELFDTSIDLVSFGADSREEKEDVEKHSWIIAKNSIGVFDEGPTGMISTVGEFVESFAKRRLNNLIEPDTLGNSSIYNDGLSEYEENNKDLS